MASTTAPAPPLPDLDQCEAEPIHIPGSIQPHGVLLALDQTDLKILQVSLNVASLLGARAADLLGRALSEAFGPQLAESVRQALFRYRSRPDAPASFDWYPAGAPDALTAHVHLSGQTIVLELEPAASDRPDPSEAIAEAMRDFSVVRNEGDLSAKLASATLLLRRLTGYDRVMVYRFDEDWHGEVIAEARRPDLEPYLGLHYPASDIPAQARQVFLVNPSRVILDVHYVPSELHPILNPLGGEPLDLSRSLLRSVSPVHLEYLRNMGVGSTMTISLVRDGRLWGLIACHHGKPHAVSATIREVACWMAQDLATQVALTEEVTDRLYAAHLQDCRDQIIFAMRRGTRLPALLGGPELTKILGAIGADGVAFIRGEDVVTGGTTPDSSRILDIAARLSALHPNSPSGLFATDCLSEHIPGVADLAASAAGVALFPLDASQSIKLMWFRSEQLRQVTWGGNPDKAVDVAPDGRLSPRQSFAAWSQIVKLRSRRWTPKELESARKLGALIDIEWRKMAEEALRESEALLKDVLDSLTANIAVLDGRGVITLVNAAWRRFAENNGGGVACLPGVDYTAVCRQASSGFAGVEATTALRGLEDVLSGAASAFNLQYPCDSPTESRWFEMRVLPLSGSRPGAVVAHEEITGQKRAEEALKRSEEQLRQAAEEALRLSKESFRLAVDNMPDALVIYDESMRYSFLNAASLARAGLPLESYLGRRDDEIYASEVYQAYLPQLRQTYETRTSTTFECSLSLPTGRYDLVVTYVPMLENDSVYRVFGFYYDITERKRNEAKLAEQTRQLQDADWRKDEFLAMLAHELRNPLAPIFNAVQLLQHDGSNEQLAWCLAVIERQTLHLTRLVDDLLDISRITRGIIELRMAHLDLADILARAVETSRPLIEARQHRLHVRFPRGPVAIVGDLVRLTQVVSNLLTNAAKFTDEGGEIWLSVDAEDEGEGKGVAIRVRDSGRGIDQDQLSRLFDLFFQVDRTSTRAEGGLGIGLSLVKHLVDLHGGTVEVRSQGLGKGSEFCVRLPVLADPSSVPLDRGIEGREGQEETEGEPSTPAIGGLRILIVDDNRDAANSLGSLLTHLGGQVELAFDGPSALRRLAAQPMDLVILDIAMPGMDGHEVARRIRASRELKQPILIAMSGLGQSADRQRSLEAGFDEHLVKPVPLDVLNSLLSSRWGLRRPDRAHAAFHPPTEQDVRLSPSPGPRDACEPSAPESLDAVAPPLITELETLESEPKIAARASPSPVVDAASATQIDQLRPAVIALIHDLAQPLNTASCYAAAARTLATRSAVDTALLCTALSGIDQQIQLASKEIERLRELFLGGESAPPARSPAT
jgi:light-regulated signal transduction histidine kinase (bacteriophytochrome)/ActR/RegA family two-component response regulator